MKNRLAGQRRLLEEKESMKWLNSFARVAEVQALCPETLLVSMGDRESDIHDLFALAARDPAGPKLLVLSVRFAEVTLQPPRDRRLPAVELWAVHLHEENTDDPEPIEWMLLTTVPVHTFDDAVERAEWYAARWGIESVPQAHRKEVRNGLTNCVEATRKMRVGPSGSAFRSGPQTTPSCCGQEPWW
jgi:hypothetical protein